MTLNLSNKKPRPEEKCLHFNIADKLKNQEGIEAVWFEDRGKQFNIYVMTKDVRNSTLDPIFDARLALSSQYPYISFNFELNPVDLEQKQIDHHIQRLI